MSVSSTPAFTAIISGAASGACAIGLPQSAQNILFTCWPLSPALEYVLSLPEIFVLSAEPAKRQNGLEHICGDGILRGATKTNE